MIGFRVVVYSGAAAGVYVGLSVDRAWTSGSRLPNPETWAGRCRSVSNTILRGCEKELESCSDKKSFLLIHLKMIIGAWIALIGALLQLLNQLILGPSKNEERTDRAIEGLERGTSKRETQVQDMEQLVQVYHHTQTLMGVLRQALMQRGVDTGLPLEDLNRLVRKFKEFEEDDTFEEVKEMLADINASRLKSAALGVRQEKQREEAIEIGQEKMRIQAEREKTLDETEELQAILEEALDDRSGE